MGSVSPCCHAAAQDGCKSAAQLVVVGVIHTTQLKLAVLGSKQWWWLRIGVIRPW